MLRNVVCDGKEENIEECEADWNEDGGSETVAITCSDQSK